MMLLEGTHEKIARSRKRIIAGKAYSTSLLALILACALICDVSPQLEAFPKRLIEVSTAHTGPLKPRTFD